MYLPYFLIEAGACIHLERTLDTAFMQDLGLLETDLYCFKENEEKLGVAMQNSI